MALTADFNTAALLYATGPTAAIVGSRPAQRNGLVVPKMRFPSQTAVAPAESATSPADISVLPETVESAADRSVGQLLKLANLPQNWDGYRAAEPKQQSIQSARKFLRSLAPGSVVPEPTLHADGNALLLYRSSDAYVELEFVGSNAIEFFARQGNSEWSSEFSLGGPMPDELRAIGFAT
jgi:hypothetical protein